MMETQGDEVEQLLRTADSARRVADQDPSSMSDIRRYLDMARDGHREAALHNLVEQGEPAIPRLEAAYRGEPDAAVRAVLVEAVWQIRVPTATAFLGEALQDPEPVVWRQALDGLVTLASHESLQILESARERLGDDGGEFGEWLDGAIEDVSGRINE
jgi:hypothetical protein